MFILQFTQVNTLKCILFSRNRVMAKELRFISWKARVTSLLKINITEIYKTLATVHNVKLHISITFNIKNY